MSTVKVVVLLVRQLRHGFTKKATLSPNWTVAHVYCCGWRSLPRAAGLISALLRMFDNKQRTSDDC